ncbi:hypothetical protein HK096_002783, partial [Nowakowskiella sp. JEL0078]
MAFSDSEISSGFFEDYRRFGNRNSERFSEYQRTNINSNSSFTPREFIKNIPGISKCNSDLELEDRQFNTEMTKPPLRTKEQQFIYSLNDEIPSKFKAKFEKLTQHSSSRKHLAERILVNWIEEDDCHVGESNIIRNGCKNFCDSDQTDISNDEAESSSTITSKEERNQGDSTLDDNKVKYLQRPQSPILLKPSLKKNTFPIFESIDENTDHEPSHRPESRSVFIAPLSLEESQKLKDIQEKRISNIFEGRERQVIENLELIKHKIEWKEWFLGVFEMLFSSSQPLREILVFEKLATSFLVSPK